MLKRRLTAVILMCPWIMGFSPPSWQDSFLTRVELLALIETLNAELLSHPSATATLERWCSDHGLAQDAKIAAKLEKGAEKPLDSYSRLLLVLWPGEPVRYRHVRLSCGDVLLSEADNWYMPDRLTPEMNRLLDDTDTPFGRAIADLEFRRETLSVHRLWSPLPEHWEAQALPPATPGRIEAPEFILEHRALLRPVGSLPVALVSERYTSAVLGFPLPH